MGGRQSVCCGRPVAPMVYLRGGTVVQEPSAIDRVLSFPYRIYEFIMFFIMTLIDVRSPPGSCPEKNVCPFPLRQQGCHPNAMPILSCDSMRLFFAHSPKRPRRPARRCGARAYVQVAIARVLAVVVGTSGEWAMSRAARAPADPRVPEARKCAAVPIRAAQHFARRRSRLVITHSVCERAL